MVVRYIYYIYIHRDIDKVTQDFYHQQKDFCRLLSEGPLCFEGFGLQPALSGILPDTWLPSSSSEVPFWGMFHLLLRHYTTTQAGPTFKPMGTQYNTNPDPKPSVPPLRAKPFPYSLALPIAQCSSCSYISGPNADILEVFGALGSVLVRCHAEQFGEMTKAGHSRATI